MPNLKRRATEAPEDTIIHPFKSPRLMEPMREITNVTPYKMLNLKRRATEAPEGTVLHPSKSPRLMAPMDEITNVPSTRGEIPKETMTMRQIRRHIEWLINTAETAWEDGNKEVVKARLAEVLAFAEILPTRTFDELEEEWHGQCQTMVDEAYERIMEMKRTIKRKTTPTRWKKYKHHIC
jgi:hypothetical protein